MGSTYVTITGPDGTFREAFAVIHADDLERVVSGIVGTLENFAEGRVFTVE